MRDSKHSGKEAARMDILPFRSRSPDAVYVQRCRSYNSRCASNICYLIPSYVSNSIDKIMHHEYRHEFSCANSHVSTLKVHQLVSAVALIPSSNRSQSLPRTLLSRWDIRHSEKISTYAASHSRWKKSEKGRTTHPTPLSSKKCMFGQIQAENVCSDSYRMACIL